MSEYKDTTSHLAIIEAWNKDERLLKRKIVNDDWATRYFPENVFYVRPLTEEEKKDSEYPIKNSKRWYGVFMHENSQIVAVSEWWQLLQAEAKKIKSVIVRVC